MTEEEHHLLIGRSDDRDRFGQLLNEENKRLLLLHGPSGAGKSSLLEAGLRRDLDTRGATIRSQNKWGGYEGEDARQFLAKKLGLTGPDPFGDFGGLEANGVLILDQFEELVRYSPRITRQLFHEILEINRLYRTKVVISFRSEYLHEFEELEKGAVNFSVGDMPVSEIDPHFALAVVKSGNRRKRTSDAQDAVANDVAAWIADQWTTARERLAEQVRVVGDDPFARVGLLHLQAFLYTLYFASRKKSLTSDTIEAALGEWRAQSADSLHLDPSKKLWQERWTVAPNGFQSALSSAVNYKLVHCDDAGREAVVDSQLRRGTRWMVERTVKHLSSAGYKLIRSAPELASFALGADHAQLQRELRPHAVTDDNEYELLAELLRMGLVGDAREKAGQEPVQGREAGLDLGVGGGEELIEGGEEELDLIDATRRDIAERVDRRGSAPIWTALLAKPGSQPFENDPREITSGYLFGLTPEDVVIEEFRRFTFALTWLEESDLIRVATPLEGRPMVSLIHDGFGTALNGWADAAKDDPEGPLSALTAPRGFTFEWPNRHEGLLPAPDLDVSDASRRDSVWSGEHRVFTNLRWQNGTVQKTRLQRIAFLNCDFQGLQFKDCELEGVVFVNCLLDGAVFSDCTFVGGLEGLAKDDEWSPDDPNFMVRTDDDVLRLFKRYLWDGDEVAGHATELFCDLPGEPAIPFVPGRPTRSELHRTYRVVRGDQERQGRLRADLVDGGVAIYGGRVSNLVVRRCGFERASGLAVRHATGSGLDLVEVQPEAGEIGPSHIEIFGSAVRHLTVSAAAGATGSMDLSVVGSMLAQTYIGTGLVGEVSAEDSSLLHVWNASPHSHATRGVSFVARNCAVHGALDITLDESTELGVGAQVEKAADIKLRGQPLVERLARMDYRRNPAQFRFHSGTKTDGSKQIEGN